MRTAQQVSIMAASSSPIRLCTALVSYDEKRNKLLNESSLSLWTNIVSLFLHITRRDRLFLFFFFLFFIMAASEFSSA